MDDGDDEVDSVSSQDPFFTQRQPQTVDERGDDACGLDAAEVYATMTLGNDNTQGWSASSCEEDLALAVEEELGRGRHRWADDLAALHDWEGRVRERAQELQLNHVTLQLQAVVAKEGAVRAERDALALRVAAAEQDQLLLEAKLRDVVSFESGGGSGSGSGEGARRPSRALMLTTVRGKLLEAATARIGELTDALSEQAVRAAEASQAHALQLAAKDADAAALREVAARLGEQLNHRTVLFAAQDRRFRESLRAQLSLQAEQGQELAALRARLQQLEGMYERTDRERIEGHLRGAAWQEELAALRAQQADDRDRAAALADELSEAMRSNAALQATVERLRGADAVDMERELALEVEELRRAARDSESQLRRQLEAARARVAQEAEARALLYDELQRLREVVDTGAGDPHHHGAMQQSSMLAEEGSREELLAAEAEAEAAATAGEVEEPVEAEAFSAEAEAEAEADMWLASGASFDQQVADDVVLHDDVGAQQLRHLQRYADVGSNHDDEEGDGDDVSEVSVAALPSPQESDAAEVAWLRAEVDRLACRESALAEQLERQRGKLALVLQRAAALSPDPDAALASELRQALAARDREAAAHREHVDVLAQQLAAYRDEVDVLVAQCQHSREVGEIAGAARAVEREEQLLFRIADLEARCAAYEEAEAEAEAAEEAARVPVLSWSVQSSQTDAAALHEASVGTDSDAVDEGAAATDAAAAAADERDILRAALCDLQGALDDLVAARQDDAADAERLRMAVADLEAQARDSARAQESARVAAQALLDQAAKAAQRRQQEQEAERAELSALVDDLRARLQDVHEEDQEAPQPPTPPAPIVVVSVVDHDVQTDGSGGGTDTASALVQTDSPPAACHAACQTSPEPEQQATTVEPVQLVALSGLEERYGAAVAQRDALALRVDALRTEAQAALDAARREHKAELKGCRRRVLAQCRGLMERQQAEFAAEREQTVLLVRKECAEILQDAQEMVRRNRRHKELQRGSSPAPAAPFNSRHDAAAAAAAVAVVSDNSSPESVVDGVKAPLATSALPMSPDVALELVRRALAAQTPSH